MKMKKIMNKSLKIFGKATVVALVLVLGNNTVFGANEPLEVINNLSTFIFSIIRAVGMILCGWGIVQIGMSLKSHDASQRATGMWSLAGGVIIMFAKEILDLITGG